MYNHYPRRVGNKGAKSKGPGGLVLENNGESKAYRQCPCAAEGGWTGAGSKERSQLVQRPWAQANPAHLESSVAESAEEHREAGCWQPQRAGIPHKGTRVKNPAFFL